MAKDILALYSDNCLKCSSLVETAKAKFPKCHFRKGNTECPASEVRIAVVGEAKIYAQRVLNARKQSDFQKEAKLLAYVAKQSESFQLKFSTELGG